MLSRDLKGKEKKNDAIYGMNWNHDHFKSSWSTELLIHVIIRSFDFIAVFHKVRTPRVLTAYLFIYLFQVYV